MNLIWQYLQSGGRVPLQKGYWTQLGLFVSVTAEIQKRYVWKSSQHLVPGRPLYIVVNLHFTFTFLQRDYLEPMDLVIVSYHLQNKQIQILKIVKLHFNNLHIKINSSCNGSRMFHQSEHPCNQELLMIKCWCYFSENSDFFRINSSNNNNNKRQFKIGWFFCTNNPINFTKHKVNLCIVMQHLIFNSLTAIAIKIYLYFYKFQE